jgi:hypothetical protein
MAVDFSALVYQHCHEMFGRPIIVTPRLSQPGQPAYSNDGVFRTRELNVLAMDGSIISEQQTLLFILESAFTIMPRQGDLIEIPAVESIPAQGSFEIIDASTNGAGETKLTIRRIQAPRP